MKKISAFAILTIFFLFTIASVSFAQVPPNNPGQQRRAEVQERINEQRLEAEKKREEVRQRIEEQREERQLKIAEQKVRIITIYWERLETRLLAAAARIDILIGRIESRVEKIKEVEEDIDTGGVEAGLLEAREMLDQIYVKIELANENYGDLLSSEDPMQTFAQVRSTVQEIRMDLIELHKMLVFMIGDIRGLRVGQTTTVAEEEGVEPTVEPSPTEVEEEPEEPEENEFVE